MSETKLALRLSNETYDTLKWIAQILLPALGTLYFTLAQVLGLPAGEQVIGTITAVDLFLGTLLGLSSTSYKNSEDAFDGVFDVNSSDPTKDLYTLQFNTDPEVLSGKTQLVLKVRSR